MAEMYAFTEKFLVSVPKSKYECLELVAYSSEGSYIPARIIAVLDENRYIIRDTNKAEHIVDESVLKPYKSAGGNGTMI
jgi:hypothetical protein